MLAFICRKGQPKHLATIDVSFAERNGWNMPKRILVWPANLFHTKTVRRYSGVQHVRSICAYARVQHAGLTITAKWSFGADRHCDVSWCFIMFDYWKKLSAMKAGNCAFCTWDWGQWRIYDSVSLPTSPHQSPHAGKVQKFDKYCCYIAFWHKWTYLSNYCMIYMLFKNFHFLPQGARDIGKFH